MASLVIEPLSEANLEAVYELCETEVPEYTFPIEWFRRFTLKDISFHPELTLVSKIDNEIVGFFMGTIRKALVVGQTGYLKFFVVKSSYRRQGLGAQMLKMLEKNFREKKIRRIRIMDCNPDYIWPGLDPHFTAGYFFLKKNGFKKRKERLNLHVNLDNLSDVEPPHEKGGFSFKRASESDRKATISFVKKNFLGTWDREADLSFRNDPATTFIAKKAETSEIVGFATHSSFFPGSFGPTGVTKDLRGKGIGSILLRWCVHDLQASNQHCMQILWVVGDTVKFYSKAIGAKIGQVFWTMKKRV